jgi:hypothetical protein
VSSTSAALRASFRVLRQNKQLIVFPAVAMPTEVVLLAGFVALDVVLTHGFSAATKQFGVGQYVLLALWFGLCALVMSCLTSVFRVAVYQYATTRTSPPQFDGFDLGNAFTPRRRWH